MTARFEVDLETDRVLFDNNWLTREELTAKIQQMLAAGDFKITRHSEALEFLAQTIAGARSLTVKLSQDQYARLEAAAQKAGKPVHAYGRDLLAQVLAGGAPAVAAPPVTVEAVEEAAPLTITPKRRDPLPGAPAATVLTPKLNLPVDAAADGKGTPAGQAGQGGPGDGRRWFNRS